MNVRTDLPSHHNPRHPGHTNMAFNYEFDEIDLIGSLEKEEQIISIPKFKKTSEKEKEKQTLKMWNYHVHIKKMLHAISCVLGYAGGRNQLKGMVFMLIWTFHCSVYYLLEFFEALFVLDSSCWCTTSIIYFVIVILCYIFILRHNLKWYLRFVHRMSKEYIFYRMVRKLRRVFKALPCTICCIAALITVLHYGLYAYNNYTTVMVIFRSNRTLVGVNRTLLVPDEPYKSMYDVFRFTSLLHVHYFFIFLLLFHMVVLYSVKKQQDVFNAYIAHNLQPTPPTISFQEAVHEFYYRLKVLHQVSSKLSLVLSIIFISAITCFILNVYNYLLINRNTMRIIFSIIFLLWVVLPLIGGSIVTSTYRRLYLIVLQIWIEKQDNVLNNGDLLCHIETEEYGEDEHDGDNGKEQEREEDEEAKETMLQKINPLSILKRISAVSYQADDEETDSDFDVFNNHNNQDKNGGNEPPVSMLGNMMRRLSCQPPSVTETRQTLSPLDFNNGNPAVIPTRPDYSKRRFSLQPDLILEVPESNRLRKVPSENTIFSSVDSVNKSPNPLNKVTEKLVTENERKKSQSGLAVPPRPRKKSNHLHLPMSETPAPNQRRRSSIQCALKGVVHKGNKMRGKTKKNSDVDEKKVPNTDYEEAIKRADELMTAKINEKLKEQNVGGENECNSRDRRLSRKPLALSFREEVRRTSMEESGKKDETHSPTRINSGNASDKPVKRSNSLKQSETDSTTSGSDKSEQQLLTKSSRQPKKTPPSGDIYRIMALQNATKTTITNTQKSSVDGKTNVSTIDMATDSEDIENSNENNLAKKHVPRIQVSADKAYHKKGAKNQRRHSLDFLTKKTKKGKRSRSESQQHDDIDEETFPYDDKDDGVLSPPSIADLQIPGDASAVEQLARVHTLQSYSEEKFSFEKFVRVLRLNDDVIAFNVAEVNVTWRRTVLVILLLIAVILSVLRKAFQHE